MADLSTLNPNLPAQATGNSLPGQAADVAAAPSAEDTVGTAAYGDKGWEQYNNLRDAGRTGNPLAIMAGMGAPGGAAPAAAPGVPANQPSELVSGGIARTLTSLGNPRLAAQEQQFQQQQIAAAAKARRESATEFFTQLMPAAFKQFPGRPDLAAGFLQTAAQQRGIQVDPAVLVKLNQDIVDGQLTPAKIGEILSDPTTNIDTVMRLGTKANFISDVAKGQAEAQKAVAEAQAAPGKASQESQMKALDIANKIRVAGQPPSKNDIDILAAAGLEPYQTDIAGVPGAKRWDVRRASESGGTSIDVTKLHQADVDQTAAKAKSREAGITTAATRTMKEQVPKVRALLDESEAALAKTETGPFKGRWKEIMAGKVGEPDENFITLRTNTDLLATLMMRMHAGGRSSVDMMNHFKNLFSNAAQAPQNLRAAFRVARKYADIVEGSKVGDEINTKSAEGTEAAPGTAAAGTVSLSDWLGANP